MGKIHNLVRENKIDELEAYLRESKNPKEAVNERDSSLSSPLFVAVDAVSPNLRVIRLLLEAGADVNYERCPEQYSLLTGLFNMAKYSEPVLEKALRSGNVEVVRVLESFGADLSYIRDSGYNAILDAIYSKTDPVEVIAYLLNQGISPNPSPTYNDEPLLVALRNGKWRSAQLLTRFGADRTGTGWTPLLEAASVGDVKDVRAVLKSRPPLEIRDQIGQSALHIALRRGLAQMVEDLLEAGASVKGQNGDLMPYLSCAIESGDNTLLLKMIELGVPIDEQDAYGCTALESAVCNGNREIIQSLLNLGASPSAGNRYEAIINQSTDKESVLLLLQAGVDTAELNNEGRRMLLGLGEVDSEKLSEITQEDYLLGSQEREGTANPEILTAPFKLAMIRAGCSAYLARERFEDPSSSSCRISLEKRPSPVWCFERFGQSTTMLPDGRFILIAGEHEDHHDPDFCIYNDVAAFSPNGEIQIFGYPFNTFEPTDFHTANLVGEEIWIIGGLGYTAQRVGNIPVYRLNLQDFRIERMEIAGDSPPRIYGHRAKLDGGHIEIWGGKIATSNLEANVQSYRLNLALLEWVKN